MRVALTGVSGFIGSVTARQLAEQGHQVTGLVRETSRRDHIEPFVDRFVVGDQADPACFDDLLNGADAVIHNSADWRSMASGQASLAEIVNANVRSSIELLERSRPLPFVFVSSVAVHHDMRPRWNGRIDADHPTRPGGYYGAYKAAVECFLWAEYAQHKRPFCAVRPSAVYGLDPKLDRSIGHPIIQKLANGQAANRQGGGKFVHVEDVAATLRHATEHLSAGSPTPPIVHLADCYARWADWAKFAAEALGVDATIDDSSPTEPKNQFTKDDAQALGVSLDRGHAGIKAAITDLITAMRDAGELPA